VKLGFMGFFVKAAINALKEIPGVNAQMDGDTISIKTITTSAWPWAPNRFGCSRRARCDELTLAGIEKNRTPGRKSTRRLALDGDLTGGTFTVSNGGVYGSLMGTPSSTRRNQAFWACIKPKNAPSPSRARWSFAR